MQTLTWTDLLPECLNEKKDESHLVVGKYPYIFFFIIIKHTRNIGQVKITSWEICMPNALYFRKSSHSACAQRVPPFFRGKTSAAFPDHVSIYYVNQTESVLNFARGQTPAGDTCVFKNVY